VSASQSARRTHVAEETEDPDPSAQTKAAIEAGKLGDVSGAKRIEQAFAKRKVSLDNFSF
jgi:hypothetical protein